MAAGVVSAMSPHRAGVPPQHQRPALGHTRCAHHSILGDDKGTGEHEAADCEGMTVLSSWGPWLEILGCKYRPAQADDGLHGKLSVNSGLLSFAIFGRRPPGHRSN